MARGAQSSLYSLSSRPLPTGLLHPCPWPPCQSHSYPAAILQFRLPACPDPPSSPSLPRHSQPRPRPPAGPGGGFPSSSAPQSPSRCSHSGLVKLRLSTPASAPLLSHLLLWMPSLRAESGSPLRVLRAPCTYPVCHPSRCLGVHAPGCDSLGAPHHRQTTAVFSQLCIFDAWHGAWHGIDAQQSFRECPCASSALLPLCRQTPIHPSRPSSRFLSPELLLCVLAEPCTLLILPLTTLAPSPRPFRAAAELLLGRGWAWPHTHLALWQCSCLNPIYLFGSSLCIVCVVFCLLCVV